MERPQPDSNEIAIRCPGCGQRFKVGPDLRGRMVECGSCDQRFRVEDEVIVRQRKTYPGEHRDPSLDRFGRVPVKAGAMPGFERANYQPQAPPAAVIEPTSPFRIVFGAAGALMAAGVAMMLMFGGEPGGLLDGASQEKRLVLAGFTAVISSALIIYASPHARIKALLVSLALSAGLLALPVMLKPEVAKIVSGTLADVEVPEKSVSEEPVGDELEAIRTEIVYEPLGKALERYEADGGGSGLTAIGVWLRGLKDFNERQVSAYLKRVTGAGSGSWIYARRDENYLMVLLDLPPDLDAVAEHCARLGKVRRTFEDLQVVEVMVDNAAFLQGPLAKLQDTEDPAFYQLNRRELESIDLKRAQDAVRRLASVEPKIYRNDIVKRMHELLKEGDTELKRDIASALAVWAEDGDGSVTAVREVAAELIEKEGTAPSGVIEFLVENQDPGVIPLLDGLWRADPSDWETLFGMMGREAEVFLLESYPTLTPILKLSATRILARAGTPASIPILDAARGDGGIELKIEIEQAIEAIGKRN